jgi:hypothetical protein
MNSQLWQFDQDKVFPPTPTLLTINHYTAHTMIMIIMYEIHIGNCRVIHQAIQNIEPAVSTTKAVVFITTSMPSLQPITSRKVLKCKRCSR